jgi:membrane protease YdiL (CAAX protease family)
LVAVTGNPKRISSDSTVPFFLLTYALTWGGSAIALGGGMAASGLWVFVSGTLLFLGSFAPSVVALGLTTLQEGTSGAGELLRHLLDWRVAVRWYIVSLLYPAAIVFSANIAHRFIAGEWVPLSYPRGSGIVFSVPLLMSVCASEEIGWRGYALPRLTKAVGLRKASLILGPAWACWHLPLFLLPGMRNYGESASLFVLGVTALSVVFAWLYTNTNGSLIPVVLLHSAIDQVLPVLPRPRIVPNPLAFGSDLMPWLITAFEWLIAAYMLAQMPRPSIETETQAESVTVDRP